MPDVSTEQRHTPQRAAAFLSDHGFPVSKSTLDKLRVTGGGPEYELFGSRVMYPESALLAWAETKRTRRLSSTSEKVERQRLRPTSSAPEAA